MKQVVSYVLVFVVGFLVCAYALQTMYGGTTYQRSYPPSQLPAPPATTVGNHSIADVARKVIVSVVSIDTKGRRMQPNFPFDIPGFLGVTPAPIPEGKASGVIIRSDGYILTNNHVVANTQAIRVTLADGKTQLPGRIVGTDPKTDLAVIKVNARNLPAAIKGDSDPRKLVVGDWVVAIGNALGLEGGATVTAGVISAQKRAFQIDNKILEDVLQTDAAINRGNSGGALANINGEVVGINTAIASTNPGGGSIGIGFAIPSNRAWKIADQLIKQGKVIRPWLGIGYMSITDDVRQAFAAQGGGKLPARGVIILQVVQGSPAEKAGLQRYDVIMEMNRKPVVNRDFVEEQIQRQKVGVKVLLLIWRNGQTSLVGVTLGERPSDV